MSVFKWIKGKLRIEGGAGTANVADVTGAFELKTLDPQVLAVLNAIGAYVSSEATQAALKARADLLGSEATLASRASEATLASRASEASLVTRASEGTLAALNVIAATLGTEATLALLKGRADLLGSEATLLALKNRGDLLGTEATLAALKDRADLLGSEATLLALKNRADLLGTEATATLIKAVLDTIYTRQADGNQLAKVGEVITTARAIYADGTKAYPAMDFHGNQRVIKTIGKLGPNQRHIVKLASVSTNSTAYLNLTNATGVPGAPAGLPAQDIQYTVPANTQFHLLRLLIVLLDKNGTEVTNVALRKASDNIRKWHHAVASGGTGSPALDLSMPTLFAAGDQILTDVRVSGGTTIALVGFAGIEEDII